MALCFAILFGIPLGVFSAVRQNTALDYVLRVVSLSGLSLPSFWLGLLILMAFVHYTGWIPIYTTPPKTLWDELLLYSIPAAAVGFRSSALMMRLTRSSMLEVLRQDYIRTARAKGASYAKVNFVHALRNAVLPIVTIVGIEAAFLVGGLIVTETVFNIPGVARFLVEAIKWRDYPIVQNLVMFIAVCVVSINFLIDMAYLALDPRIAVVIPSCYVTSLPMRMANRIFEDPDTDPEQDPTGLVSAGVDHPGLLLLVYPRALFVASAVKDFVPIEGARKTFRNGMWAGLSTFIARDSDHMVYYVTGNVYDTVSAPQFGVSVLYGLPVERFFK